MLLRREKLDNPVECLVGVVRVECREAKMPCFSKLNRILHGLAGTHLTNENNVWCLSQRVFQRNFKALGINANFPLGYDAALVLVYEFNRVFNGNDVSTAVTVTVPQHGSQRC